MQPIQRVNGKFVVFSEGNLVSNQSPLAGLPESSQDGLIALLDCVARSGKVRVRRVRYVPVFVNHPDYRVLPVGDALRDGEGDPTLLRGSYRADGERGRPRQGDRAGAAAAAQGLGRFRTSLSRSRKRQ